jgi:hypothetical protein
MLFASIIAYGILPAFAAALVILCGLWLLDPLIAIALAALWLLKWVIWDFFIALIVGFGGGLGLRASGVFRPSLPQQSLRDMWQQRGGSFRDDV